MAREAPEEARVTYRMAADFLDFIETISGDYYGTYSDLRRLLNVLQGITAGAALGITGLLISYWAYTAPSQSNIFNAFLTAMSVTLVFILGYLVIRIRRSRGDLDHLAFHMDELVNTQTETVLQTEVLDQTKPNNEQLTTLLRTADSVLDQTLEDHPDHLKLDVEVQGEKHSVRPLIYIGVPYESWWERFNEGGLRSKLEWVWMVFRHDGNVDLTYVKSLHENLSDVLPHIRPLVANIYVFSEGEFSEEAIKFVEDEDNWIPHWHIDMEDEESAVINLIKMEGKGRFSVVSMPWLKALRQERVEMQKEAD